MEQRPRVEVVIPKIPSTNQRQRATLSANEALKYTPLTSSVLHSSDLIPVPALRRHKQNGRLTTAVERKTSLQTPCSDSVRNKIAALLNHEALAEIKFSRAPVASHGKIGQDLSDISKMALKVANIDHRYPSPPGSQSPPSLTETKLVSRKSSLPTPGRSVSPQKDKVVVEIAPPPPSFRRDDYVSAPDSPKRRKLDSAALNSAAAIRMQTQRELSDATLFQFQNQLGEIFDALDRFDPEVPNEPAPQDAWLFYIPDEEDESDIRLSTSMLEKLQVNLKQLVAYGRLEDLPSNDLKRLQQLCERSIDVTQTLRLQLPSSPSDEDQEVWQHIVQKAENGVASASVFAYLVLGCKHDTSIISTEVTGWLPNVLVNIFENGIIPIVEARPDGQDTELFEVASRYQQNLKNLLESGKKLLDLVASICIQVQGLADFVNTTEFLAAKLIFVQNAYNEKSAVLGSQNYERTRKQAMSALAKLYSAFPQERSAILDEILSSLDKLPSTSRSARQYKLGDGKSIQLISALFMQLVQTVALENVQDGIKHKRGKLSHRRNSQSLSDDEDVVDDMEVDDDSNAEEPEAKLSKLQRKADSLLDNAVRVAQEIVVFFVGKASKVSKSGDSPYRNLLDLLVEDLIHVFQNLEWPAAELLLRILAAKMIDFAENEKAASIKNMALEYLGSMGSAISTLTASVRGSVTNNLRNGETKLSTVYSHLLRLADDQLVAGIRYEELISLDGPFAIVSHHLASPTNQSLRAKSARSYFLAQYAKGICLYLEKHGDGELRSEVFDINSEIVNNVLEQFSEIASESTVLQHTSASTNQEAQLAYLLSILNLGFCRRFGTVVKTLLSSFSSDQAQVRSRSLKSVVTMLETDPSLLDRDPSIVKDVFRCAEDESAMVRDSALSLIARFIITKPAFEQEGIKRLLQGATDTKVGVQKRALTHLKDVYNQDTRPKLKAVIAQTFLRRTMDAEDSITELALRSLNDMWVNAYSTLAGEAADTAKSQVALELLTDEIVTAVQADQSMLSSLLTSFLKWSFTINKSPEHQDMLCKRIVKVLFQNVIAGTITPAGLVVLTAFAQARPQSIAPQQLSNLQSYLNNYKTADDLFMLKSVVGIFRYVLPQLSNAHNALLKGIQSDLMSSMNKIPLRAVVDEVVLCLRTIDGVLQNTFRLAILTSSAVKMLHKPDTTDRARERLLCIIGAVGKHVDLEGQKALVQKEIASFESGTVYELLATTTFGQVAKGRSGQVQLNALESLGSICQAWPVLLNKRNIRDLLYHILEGKLLGSLDEEGNLNTQIIVLKMFEELYTSRALAKGDSGTDKNLEDQVQDLRKLGGNSKTRDGDSAIAAITNDVFNRVHAIAMSEAGEKGLLSIQTLASISHQGMIHPKQSTGVFVALETSSDSKISAVAEKAHRLLHQQHESVCEREYINAVHAAFVYQRQVYQNSSGVASNGASKLSQSFAIINTSGSKYVKKFLSNLISRCNTDLAKLDDNESTLTEHVHFVRFVAQNLAFFEYTKMDELLHTILQLELAFGKNGGEIAQAIEMTIHVGAGRSLTENDGDKPESMREQSMVTLEPTALYRLAAAACAVTMISEARSHLRRQYGVTRDAKMVLQQSKQAKEIAKTPLKVHGISGDRFLSNTRDMTSSLADSESMLTRCREFVSLMAVDEEVRVGEEPDGLGETSSAYLDQESYQQLRTKKRKSNAGSAGGTPKKARGRPPKLTNGGRRSSSISSRDDFDADFEV